MLTHDHQSASRSLILRVARQIHERVLAVAHEPASTLFPQATVSELQTLLGSADKARRRGWHAAAAEVELRSRSQSQRLIRQLQDWQVAQEFVVRRHAQCSTTVNDIYRDLLALEDEFEEVRIDTVQRTLTVRTEPIVLEDVNFGPFDIVLEWRRLGNGEPYRCIAVEPLYCASDDSLTHPHVQAHCLCSGEGKVPISWALARGDVLEFCMLVRQVLRNYDGSGAYKSVDDWFGKDCACCGGSLYEDDRHECDACHDDVCSDCYDSCTTCGDYFCHDCSNRCVDCEESVCERCALSADPDEGRLCRACDAVRNEPEPELEIPSTISEEQYAHENEAAETLPTESGPEAEVHTRCLGQTYLPA